MSANSGSENEVVIPKEKLEQFERGDIKLEAFSAGERAYMDKLMRGEIATDEAPAGGEIPAVKEASEQGKPVEENKDLVPGSKYKDKADEANTYKQKADSFAKKLEEANAQLEALKALSTIQVPSPIKEKDQVWSDSHQVSIAERLARLEAQTLQGVRGSQEKLEVLTKELKEQQTFAQVNAFAFNNPELRLTRPFEEANAEYVAFTQKLGATPKDMSLVDRYFEDATFRKEMESKGVRAPKDFDKLNVILEVFHRKNSMGYPNFDDAYLGHLRESKQLEKRFNGTYLKGVEDAVNKIANNKNETTILDPGKSNDSGFAMSESQMEAWLTAHPRPITSSDKAIMAQIQGYLEARQRG